jgi:alpha-L-arabinofuranosidase
VRSWGSRSEPDARNTLERPERVGLVAIASARVDGTQLTIELPAVSWTAISLAV